MGTSLSFVTYTYERMVTYRHMVVSEGLGDWYQSVQPMHRQAGDWKLIERLVHFSLQWVSPARALHKRTFGVLQYCRQGSGRGTWGRVSVMSM